MTAPENVVEVPWEQLHPDTLQRLIEEFVTRDGTDYGEREISVVAKVEQVKEGLRHKHWLIVFDADTEQCNVVSKDDWNELQSGNSP